jgi:putative transposase
MEIRYRRRMHLSGFDYTDRSHVYFLTLCTDDKRPLFKDAEIARLIIDEMELRRNHDEIILFCFCIMPDHVHMMLSLSKGYQKSLINWVSAFKRHSARAVKKSYGIEQLWQKNFYDHVVRRDESLIKVTEYILNNPVRKVMVREWKEYPYSRIVDPLPV